MNQLKPFSIEYLSILVKALYQIFLLLKKFLNKMPDLLPPNPKIYQSQYSIYRRQAEPIYVRGRTLVISVSLFYFCDTTPEKTLLKSHLLSVTFPLQSHRVSSQRAQQIYLYIVVGETISQLPAYSNTWHFSFS